VSHVWQLGLILLLCCLMLSPAEAEDDQPKANQKAVAPAQIAEWIVQLDDDLYDNRKNAQEGLENSGQQALEATLEEARVGSLESSTRALNIILSWTESSDHTLKIAALDRLSTLPNHPIESGLAAKLLADAHERYALKSLLDFGARFKVDLMHARTVPVVVGLRNLHIIIDASWKGDLDGLKHLAAVPRATTISFYFAPLDDRVLQHLTGLPNTLQLEFYGTPISTKTQEQLAKLLPKVQKVVVTEGALLGIRGDGFAQGPVVIIDVSKGFAADKAGLLKGDKITEFEGEEIKDFHDLTSRIGKFKPGETVELTILRGDEVIKKQVTFDGWGKHLTSETGDARHILPPPRKILLERR